MVTSLISKEDINKDDNNVSVPKQDISLKAIDDALASVDSIIGDIRE